ncbi:MAG: hypothetical protein GX138_08885 [Firmicutes bacterium]|jgi:hypothetical protein|nr:hypothetical protein [Bacillota bacterium]
MKMELIFDSENANDRVEYQHAVNGAKMAAAIHDLDSFLSARVMYMEPAIEAEEVRKMLRRFLADQGIIFDNMIF